jgi:prolyl-tRNA editing enzyme YbaK/EbsC (Cys-tRNA(Pro) deacylase)
MSASLADGPAVMAAACHRRTLSVADVCPATYVEDREPRSSTVAELQDASLRVAEAARALGLSIEIKALAASTRTAEEAAAACACDVAQIVKSLVFRGGTSGKPYLLLVSGANRVDEAGVAAVIGEPLVRPDARFVREVTGYAIGGIPPFGHATALATFIDRDLLGHPTVFAAAGTPKSIFAVDPRRLAEATAARVIAVTQ